MIPSPTTPHERLAGAIERVTFHSEQSGFCVLRVKVRGKRDLMTLIGSGFSRGPGRRIPTPRKRSGRDRGTLRSLGKAHRPGPGAGRPASSDLIRQSGIWSERATRRWAAAGPASQYDHSTTCHHE
jgi:hypothetical protein